MPEPVESELNDFAAALAALRPRQPDLDRDRLLFRAGRASAPPTWPWRLAATASAVAAAGLAAVLLFRPAPAPVEHTVYVRVAPPAPPPKEEAPPPAAPAESPPFAAPPLYSWPSTPYSRLEDRVLRWGLDGLAEPAPPAEAPPETVDSLLRSL